MRQLLISIICLVIYSGASAQTIIPFYSGSDTKKNSEPTIRYKIKGETIAFTINIENALNLQIEKGHKKYDRFYIKNWGRMAKEGFPEIPSYTDLVPVNKIKVNLRLMDCVYKELDNILLYPTRFLEDDSINGENFCFDEKFYSQNKYYPESIISLKDVQEFRGNKYAIINVSPIQYNPVTKKLRCYSKIEYSLDNFNNILSRNTKAQTPFVRDDYFVICTDEALTTLFDFITWKKRQGFKVHVLTKSQWTTSSEVKDSINTHLNICDVNSRKYMLIVGNHSTVPADVIFYNYYANDRYVTDYNYACLGNNGSSLPPYMTNFAVGRIPYDSLGELETVASKIISYQQNPQYFGKTLFCAKFDGNDSIEGRRSIKNSEEIKDYLVNYNINTQRIYYANPNISPKYYSKTFSLGEELPQDLQRPYFPWNGTAGDIVNAINNNTPNIVMYNGHGSNTEWSDLGLRSRHIQQLTNSFYPIVFSKACWNGCYAKVDENLCVTNKPTLAYEFLKQSNGGASAVLAFSHKITAMYDDILPAAFFDTLFPIPGLIPIVNPYFGYYLFGDYYNDYSVGNAMNGARTKLMQYFNETDGYILSLCQRFHCFGDPSTELYTGIPEDLSTVDIKQVNDSIVINTNGIQNCKVVLIPKDESQDDLFMVADSITGRYVFPNITTVYNISIQKHNCALRYYDSYDIYLQNMEFSNGTYCYEGRNVYIGKNVTNEAPQGNVVVKSGATLSVKGVKSVQTSNDFEVKVGGTFNIE